MWFLEKIRGRFGLDRDIEGVVAQRRVGGSVINRQKT